MQVQEPSHYNRPLNNEGCDEEIQPEAAEAVSLQKSHQEAEADEYHHMDILEHWKGKMDAFKKKDWIFPSKYINLNLRKKNVYGYKFDYIRF